MSSLSTAGSLPAARVIAAWRPRSLTEEQTLFARRAVSACGVESPARARSLLSHLARLARFGAEIGLVPSAETLLRPAVIERFVISGLSGASDGVRGTVRANLRFVGRRVVREKFPPDPLALSRTRAKGPYQEGEIAAYLALADAQPTADRKMRANALICLGAGAGLIGADLRLVRGSDVFEGGGTTLVQVSGKRERVVPVLSGYRDRLGVAASFAGAGFILGGRLESRHNLTNRLVSQLASESDLPRLDLGRLRAYWLCRHATGLHLGELLQAAGLRDSKHLFDVLSYLPTPTEDDVIAALSDAGEPS